MTSLCPKAAVTPSWQSCSSGWKSPRQPSSGLIEERPRTNLHEDMAGRMAIEQPSTSHFAWHLQVHAIAHHAPVKLIDTIAALHNEADVVADEASASLVCAAALGDGMAEDQLETSVIGENDEPAIGAYRDLAKAQIGREELCRRRRIGNVQVQVIEAHLTAPWLWSTRRSERTDARPGWGHVAGSHGRSQGSELHGEGTGLTTTDPAFFDGADVARASSRRKPSRRSA